MRRLLGVVFACGCRINFDPLGGDAALGPWSAPMPVPGASTTMFDEEDCSMSSDETEIIFAITDYGDIFEMTRVDRGSPWNPPQRVTTLSSPGGEGGPRLSADDRTVYFSRSGTSQDVYTSTRSAVGQPWSAPVLVSEVSDPMSSERWLSPCAGGRYMVIRDLPIYGDDVMEGQLGVQPPTRIDAINSMGYDSSVFVTADCNTVYFASGRTGDIDLYVAHRDAIGAPWSEPVALTEFNTPAMDEDPWLSPDGRTFMWSSSVAGTRDLYFATR